MRGETTRVRPSKHWKGMNSVS
jgi:hypothetical protein